MRTSTRLKGLKKWIEAELCRGREMKTPDERMDISVIKRQEPACCLAWYPTRPDRTGRSMTLATNVCPGILIMPDVGRARNMTEERFDRYDNVHRPDEMGQTLAVNILFSVYEPGVRLPGFIESAKEPEGMELSLLMEGTEQGLFTLTDWMDELVEKLLGKQHIPDTDLYLLEKSLINSLYTDQNFVVDKRPIYYGYVNCTFGCYSSRGRNPDMEKYLL